MNSEFKFADKAMAEALAESVFVILILGWRDRDTRQFAYISVKGNDLARLREDFSKQGFDAKNYGEVLHWGIGTPDEQTRQMMEARYNCNHAEIITIPPVVN